MFSHVHDVPYFLLLFHITHLHQHTLYSQNHCTKNSLVYFPFPKKKTMHDLMFFKGFWKNQSFSTKTKIKLVFVVIDSSRNPSDLLKRCHTPRKT